MTRMSSTLRVPILVEMLRRMGFPADAARLDQVWRGLYDPQRFHSTKRALEAGRRYARRRSQAAEIKQVAAWQCTPTPAAGHRDSLSEGNFHPSS